MRLRVSYVKFDPNLKYIFKLLNLEILKIDKHTDIILAVFNKNVYKVNSS